MAKSEKPRLYSYCIPYDDGAAPNPFWGICTLAICKPVIRRNAKECDWVVGTGSKNSPIGDRSKHVVYAMKVTLKLKMKDYDQFCREKYPKKIPEWGSKSFPRRVGDCIYDYSRGNKPKQRKGVHNEKNRKRDLGGKFVLVSKHFYYFGAKPKKVPEHLQPIIKQGQGHKSKSNDPYVDDFEEWIKKYDQNKRYGEPQLKEKIMRDRKFIAECAEHDLKEADMDEKLARRTSRRGAQYVSG